MLLFNERIREERERLGLTQEQVAQLTKKTVQSQRNYESGKRTPDIEYLDILDKSGFDSGYILTGERSCDPELLGLNNAERTKAVIGMVIDVTEELGLDFESDGIKHLMSYANAYCPTKAALKSFIESAVLMARDLDKHNTHEAA